MTVTVLNVALDVVGGAAQAVQSEVSDLEDETGVDHAVGGLEIAVGANVGAVYELHATHNVVHQGQLKHPVQLELLVLQYVLQGALRAVFGEQKAAPLIQTGAIELDQVIVLQVFHALQLQHQTARQNALNIIQLNWLDGHLALPVHAHGYEDLAIAIYGAHVLGHKCELRALLDQRVKRATHHMICGISEHDIIQRDLPAHRINLSLGLIVPIAEEEANGHYDYHYAKDYRQNGVPR